MQFSLEKGLSDLLSKETTPKAQTEGKIFNREGKIFNGPVDPMRSKGIVGISGQSDRGIFGATGPAQTARNLSCNWVQIGEDISLQSLTFLSIP